MEVTPDIMAPVVQYGFAGLSMVLLAILVWLINQLLVLIKSNNEALNAVHASTQQMISLASDGVRLQREIHDKLLARPCIARSKP